MIAIIFIAITYGIIEMFKIFIKSKYEHFIPLFACCIGIIIAILTYIFAPNLLYENCSILASVIIGLCCGLSATGWHQMLLHLYLNKENNSKQKVIKLKEIDFNKTSTKIYTREDNNINAQKYNLNNAIAQRETMQNEEPETIE